VPTIVAGKPLHVAADGGRVVVVVVGGRVVVVVVGGKIVVVVVGGSVVVVVVVGGAFTVVVAVPVLLPEFGSVEPLVAAVALLLMIVPGGVPALTFTTIWKAAVSPLPTLAFEKTTLPVPPATGELIVHPVPVVTAADTKVVLTGTASVTVVLEATLGPPLLKLIV